MNERGKINSSILGSRSLGLNDVSGSNQQSLGFGKEQKERESRKERGRDACDGK